MLCVKEGAGDKGRLKPADGKGNSHDAASHVSPGIIRTELERIIASKEFAHSESLKRFLRHSVELTLQGQTDRLKESLLGVELFGRAGTFDPRMDPIVRVQAVKLRSRLRQYYASEGQTDPYIIEFPKGGYIPVFRSRRETGAGQALPGSRWLLYAVATAAALLAGTTIWRQSRQEMGQSEWTYTQLAFTTGATSAFPVLSRQGNLLAFASDRGESGNLDLFVQALGVDEAVPLTSHLAQDRQPDFSPDGTRIVFQSDREGGGIYVLSLLSRVERKVAGRGYWPRFSPDGARIAFRGGDGKLYTVPSSGGEPQVVQSNLASPSHPLWTPDGKHLLVLTGDDSAEFDWRVVPVEGGPAATTGAGEALRRHRLGTRSYRPIPGDWLGDRVVFSAGKGQTASLWQILLSPKTLRVSGEPEQLTSGPGPDTFPRAAAEPGGRMRIVFVRESIATHLWSLLLGEKPTGENAGERLLSQDPSALPYSSGAWPQLSSDGSKLVFCSARLGNPDVFLRDLKTGRETPVAANLWPEEWPAISPDGSRVAYVSTQGGQRTLQLWEAAEGTTKRVCNQCGTPIQWSGDGKMILLSSGDPARLRALKIPSGEIQDLFPNLKYTLREAALSPDGGWIAMRTEAMEPSCPSVFLARFPGGSQGGCAEWISLAAAGVISGLAWSSDGRWLYFLSKFDGFNCVWRQELDPASKRLIDRPMPVRHFHHYQKHPVSGGGIVVSKDKLVAWLTTSASGLWMAELGSPQARHAVIR